jgi:putative transposase
MRVRADSATDRIAVTEVAQAFRPANDRLMVCTTDRMLPKRPRLQSTVYVGFQRYFFTFCTADRRKWFIDAAHVEPVRGQILDMAPALDIEIIAHCFMPDHVHLLVEGQADSADACRFVHQAKQRSGFAFTRAFGARLWQPSYYDRILREEETSLSVTRYIFDNPVVGGLVESPRDYPFLGSGKYSVEEILEAIAWKP